MKMWDNTINWVLLLTIPSAVTSWAGLLGRFPSYFQRYVMGIAPLQQHGAPEMTYVAWNCSSWWGGMAEREIWCRVIHVHSTTSTIYMHTPQYSLYPLIALMQRGNKSPDIKAAWRPTSIVPTVLKYVRYVQTPAPPPEQFMGCFPQEGDLISAFLSEGER